MKIEVKFSFEVSEEEFKKNVDGVSDQDWFVHAKASEFLDNFHPTDGHGDYEFTVTKDDGTVIWPRD